MLDIIQGSKLIRNQKLEYRVQYWKDKISHLQKEGKNIEEHIIIVIEHLKDMKWENTCLVGRRPWPVNKLIQFAKKYSGKPTEGVNLVAPKNGVIIQANRTIGQLYDLYHDRDDRILYLKVLQPNSFGGKY